VPAGQNFGHLSDCRLHLVWSEGLNVDLIYISRQTLLQIVGIGGWRIDPVEGSLLLGWSRNPKDFAFRSCEGNHDQIVLICPVWRLALGDQQSDDAQRDALDLDDGADRIFVGTEQLLGDGLPKDRDQRSVAVILL
jgi:hypothetical protein